MRHGPYLVNWPAEFDGESSSHQEGAGPCWVGAGPRDERVQRGASVDAQAQHGNRWGEDMPMVTFSGTRHEFCLENRHFPTLLFVIYWRSAGSVTWRTPWGTTTTWQSSTPSSKLTKSLETTSKNTKRLRPLTIGRTSVFAWGRSFRTK